MKPRFTVWEKQQSNMTDKLVLVGASRKDEMGASIRMQHGGVPETSAPHTARSIDGLAGGS